MNTAAAVLLDKDGTLIEDLPYNVDPARIRLMPGAAAGLGLLAAAGYRLAVVSNQPGVALGRFDEAALVPVAQRLKALFAECGARLEGFFYCPHHPRGRVPRYTLACQCRKPRPGLLSRAARVLRLDLSRCWMVGDILHDVQAGREAGARTVLIDNGHETEWLLGRERTPDWVAADLHHAAHIIVHAGCEPGRGGAAAGRPAHA